MTEIWTWERFVPGDELGTAPLVYSRELVNMWLEIYPDVIEQEAFSGLANAVTMRAYLSVVTPRPPGNIHARQRLSIFRRPAIDEPLETTVSCAAKELRRQHRFVTFGALTRGSAGDRICDGLLTPDMGAMTNELLPVELRVDAEAIRRYAELTQDFNPLHLDPEFARRSSVGGIIAHGTLSMNLILQAIARTFGPAALDGVAVDIRFVKPIRLGDIVTSGGQRRDAGCEFDVWVADQNGARVIEGSASIGTDGE